MIKVAWIGLGSNLDQPRAHIQNAVNDLKALSGTRVLAVSGLYKTTPVGGPANQPDYCNACAALATDKTAWQLLADLQAIEQAHGRIRDVRWGPRTLDLDMLVFEGLRTHHPKLELPHPRANQRAFVLVPLAQIAPALEIAGRRVVDWLAQLDSSDIQPWFELK